MPFIDSFLTKNRHMPIDVGDFVKPVAFTSAQYPYPGWYDSGVPGVPYSKSSDWVGVRCKVLAVETVDGVPISQIQVAGGTGNPFTAWPTAKLTEVV